MLISRLCRQRPLSMTSVYEEREGGGEIRWNLNSIGGPLYGCIYAVTPQRMCAKSLQNQPAWAFPSTFLFFLKDALNTHSVPSHFTDNLWRGHRNASALWGSWSQSFARPKELQESQGTAEAWSEPPRAHLRTHDGKHRSGEGSEKTRKSGVEPNTFGTHFVSDIMCFHFRPESADFRVRSGFGSPERTSGIHPLVGMGTFL